MSRLPPSLLYLTIYNPTLRPAAATDDEDAEEQAHILFYIAREHAVSRDRILRQVGLAKALVNFSQMFSQEEPCDNVHSQSRRMIMISPEADYWIHACFELAKTPRPALDKGKGKAKEKDKDQRGKDPETAYDFHDSSLHDLALRTHILRGYEQFKLSHGSFTSILSTLGQQALELNLERFFTVWAFKWDIDDDSEFGDHLGVPLHPLYKSIIPLLDTFASDIPPACTPFVLAGPSLVSSTRFSSCKPPLSLPRYLLSLVSSKARPPTTRRDSRQALQSRNNIASSSKDSPFQTMPHVQSQTQDSIPNDPIITKNGTIKANAQNPPGSPTGFMTMSGMNTNMNLTMDMRKWNWPGYLTFGRGIGKKPAGTGSGPGPSKLRENEKGSEHKTDGESEENLGKGESRSEDGSFSKPEDQDASRKGGLGTLAEGHPTIEVTMEALPPESPPESEAPVVDGSATTDSETPSEAPLPSIETTTAPGVDAEPSLISVNTKGADLLAPTASNSETSSLALSTTSAASEAEPTPGSSETSLSEPLPSFSITNVFLADGENVLATRRRKVLYLTKHRITLALVWGDEQEYDEAELESLAQKAVTLIRDIRRVIKDDEEQKREGAEGQLPSVAKILQPKNRHVISSGGWTFPSPGFKSSSEHLYDGHQTLDRDPDILEIFSRGQQPQHWHISKRGLGTGKDGNPVEGEVFMEVLRKEDSLIDVDNELAGVVRRFTHS